LPGRHDFVLGMTRLLDIVLAVLAENFCLGLWGEGVRDIINVPSQLHMLQPLALHCVYSYIVCVEWKPPLMKRIIHAAFIHQT